MDIIRGCPLIEQVGPNSAYHPAGRWDYWDGEEIVCSFCGARRKPRPVDSYTKKPTRHERIAHHQQPTTTQYYENPKYGIKGQRWISAPPILAGFVDSEMFQVEAAFKFFSASEQVSAPQVPAAVNAWATLKARPQQGTRQI